LEEILQQVLAEDLPRRREVVRIAAHHLQLVEESNRWLNLTRIRDPREAAIKHVVDSLLPWRRLLPFERLLDLGSGPGFPGIPLAALFAEKSVLLCESSARKATFLQRAVTKLQLANTSVQARRAEQVLLEQPVDAIVVRAVGSGRDLLRLLKRARGRFELLLLYKGPLTEQEEREALREATALGCTAHTREDLDLPEAMGRRTILEYRFLPEGDRPAPGAPPDASP
jgi:16S rRNA (guanine527-N7)-methyltransferase